MIALSWPVLVLLAVAGLHGRLPLMRLSAAADSVALYGAAHQAEPGLPPAMTLGTNKTAVVSRDDRGAVLNCWRAKLIDPKIVVRTALFSFIAGASGAYCAARIDREVLKKIVPIFLVGAALYALFSPKLGDEKGTPRIEIPWFAAIFGIAIGEATMTASLAPAQSMFWMMACVLMLGQDMRRAAGTTRVVNLASNLAALLAYAHADCLRFDAGLAMIVGQLVGARLGSGLVITRGASVIRPLYITMALAIAAKLLWDALRT